MKKTVLSLAIVTLVAALAPNAEARTRFSVSFGHGAPAYCYRPPYAHPVVMRTHSRYRYKRLHRPYYSRAYFRHRPHTRIVVKSCY
ncbi:MAG: hypothetical protein L0Z48_01115 [candidate division Zixibacteria bacterium]|nr:hypothetical protein [candidate division Zixibacteria bacterium]MCI0595123.1 hypothetical protein [candidate division Zixibacteria bacterium]